MWRRFPELSQPLDFSVVGALPFEGIIKWLVTLGMIGFGCFYGMVSSSPSNHFIIPDQNMFGKCLLLPLLK